MHMYDKERNNLFIKIFAELQLSVIDEESS